MSLLKSAATISSLTLLSRITGVIRDMLIARYFGSSAATDAFYVAFRLPNMLRRLFAEGAFQQAFVPMLSDVKANQNAEDVRTFIDRVFSVLACALLITSVVGVLAAPALVWLIAGGLAENAASFDLATELTRWMFPYIFFMSLVAMSAGVLNTWKHFAIPAFTPVLLNLSFITFILFLTPYLERPIFALAVAVIVGGVLQLGIQIPSLMKLGVLPRPVNPLKALKDFAVRKVLKLMVPALFGVGVAQLSLLINTNIASRLGTGSVTWLSFADRLMEFPTALLGVALASVLLPGLSSAFAKNDLVRYNALLDNGLRLVILFAVPAAVGMGLMADALVAFLYQGKNFQAYDVAQTSIAVVGYSFGLIGLIAIKILAPAFYARKDIRTPVKVAAVSLVCVQVSNLVFVPFFAHAGLALSIGVGSCINALLLFCILRRRQIYRPLKGWLRWLTAVLVASVVMGALLIFIQQGIDWAQMQAQWIQRAILVLLSIAVAIVVYFAILFLFGFRLKDLKA
ncbi:MAG TPA: murein biosynthesis integral membrane protein MurJ [Candidatus Aphodousia faecipullorum]|nr:murein biosynthesis integral membrane protein MurJ [Candidatus Aphodousia faecipullorum]